MPRNAREILSEAVARNSAMVLSLPSAGMLRNHKSRFLNEADGGVWIESVEEDRVLIQQLLTDATPCGVSFKVGDQKISFVAKIARFELEYRINADTAVQAVLVDCPADIKVMQRRSNYRAPVPSDSDLRVQVWRIPEYVRLKDKPNRSAELNAKLRDISTGGIGVTISAKDGEPPKVLPGERLRIALKNGESPELIIEGRMRSPRPGGPPDVIHTGIQFQGLQNGLEGRQMLTELNTIIGGLQRDEARRHRMGIA